MLSYFNYRLPRYTITDQAFINKNKNKNKKYYIKLVQALQDLTFNTLLVGVINEQYFSSR